MEYMNRNAKLVQPSTSVGTISNDEVSLDWPYTADISRYTMYQADRQRLISIISASISIVAGFIGIYFFSAIDYRKRVFRHQLVIFLILHDFIKAIFLLVFPATVMANIAAYDDLKFCKASGFFTAFAIEGSDIAILSFAIHVALLVYRPNNRIKRGNHYEGGLYRYRHTVYVVSVLFPIVLAAIPFVSDHGYVPLTNWCYTPSRPIWYRLALSWIPRYIIMATIVVIYCCIYRHITKQYSDVENTLAADYGSRTRRQKFTRTFKNFMRYLLFFKLTTKNDKESKSIHRSSLQSDISQETLQHFRARRMQAQWQMRAIFIYPASYLLLWIFTTIVHGMDLRFGLSVKPHIWMNGIAAFMQPFNCTVDTAVFLIREKPWKITTIRLDRSQTENYKYPRWRRLISFLPLFSLPKPLEIRQSENINHLKHEAYCVENANMHDFSGILSGQKTALTLDVRGNSIAGSNNSFPNEKSFLFANVRPVIDTRTRSPISSNDRKWSITTEHVESVDQLDFMDFLKHTDV